MTNYETPAGASHRAPAGTVRPAKTGQMHEPSPRDVAETSGGTETRVAGAQPQHRAGPKALDAGTPDRRKAKSDSLGHEKATRPEIRAYLRASYDARTDPRKQKSPAKTGLFSRCAIQDSNL